MEEINVKAQRPWYQHWHSILDEVLGKKAGFDLEAAIADPSGDFRMHFCTWDLPDADLHRCFSIFSCGKELARRAIEMRLICREKSFSLSETEAIKHMKDGLEGYRYFSKAPCLRQGFQIVRGTDDEIYDQLNAADYFLELLEYMDCTDSLSVEIRGFLNETLYRVASSFDITEYILWPLYVDKNEIDPQRHFAMLNATGTYFARISADGPTLFIIDDGT